MQSSRKIPHRKHCKTLRAELRFLFAIMVSFALFLGQALPGFATTGSGVWVEVCSDGEVYLHQLGSETDDQSHECTHCSQCLAGVSAMLAGFPSGKVQASRAGFLIVQSPVEVNDAGVGPEHLWVLSRAPPYPAFENAKTKFASSSALKNERNTFKNMRLTWF